MEDPGSNVKFYRNYFLLIVLTLLNAFSRRLKCRNGIKLNRSRRAKKLEEGDKKYTRLLSVLEQPNPFLIHYSGGGSP